MTLTKEDAKHIIARLEAQRDEMIERFQGVRPSYVSADLADLVIRINEHKTRLEKMEGESDDQRP